MDVEPVKLAATASAAEASFTGAGVQRAASPLWRGAGAAAHCWGQGATPIGRVQGGSACAECRGCLLYTSFYSIVYGAFNPKAVTGGIVGSFFLSMKKGVSRGIFSNEAGLGTGSIAHACADTKNPVKQGYFGIFEVFTDTIVICTLTALVILCSGVPVNYGEAAGAELTILGFTSTYGNWVSIFTAVAMCCFAFSTIIGWGLYGARCIEFLFSSKMIKPFMVIYSLAVSYTHLDVYKRQGGAGIFQRSFTLWKDWVIIGPWNGAMYPF